MLEAGLGAGAMTHRNATTRWNRLLQMISGMIPARRGTAWFRNWTRQANSSFLRLLFPPIPMLHCSGPTGSALYRVSVGPVAGLLSMAKGAFGS